MKLNRSDKFIARARVFSTFNEIAVKRRFLRNYFYIIEVAANSMSLFSLSSSGSQLPFPPPSLFFFSFPPFLVHFSRRITVTNEYQSHRRVLARMKGALSRVAIKFFQYTLLQFSTSSIILEEGRRLFIALYMEHVS